MSLRSRRLHSVNGRSLTSDADVLQIVGARHGRHYSNLDARIGVHNLKLCAPYVVMMRKI